MSDPSIGVVELFPYQRREVPAEPLPDFLFIGELAQATGTNPKTIRFYEREGLIAPARHGRFRVYSRADERQLKSVLRLRAMGLSLAQIRDVLAQAGTVEDAMKTGKFAALLTAHLAELERRQAYILSEIEATRRALSNCGTSKAL